jgi:proteasome assembly chaperone (PAC2) family protein
MEEIRNVRTIMTPRLRHPHMICGISGWVDGGEAATGCTQYLIKKLKAVRFAEMPMDNYNVYQVPGQLTQRPYIKIEDGLLKEHRLPQNWFYYNINPHIDNDIILFLGTEPCLKWEEYTETIADVAQKFNVEKLYLLGGVLNKTPHTKEPRISCTCSSAQLKEDMQEFGLHFGSYEGPGSIGTMIMHTCQKRQIPVVSLMVSATYYPEFNIVIQRNPKAIRAVARMLNQIIPLNADLSELDQEVMTLEVKLGLLVGQNSQLQTYVNNLEKEVAEMERDESVDISANEAVNIVEDLLKGEN